MTDITKEAFREKATKLIDKVKKEFGITIHTKLTIKSRSKELCKGRAEVSGIVFTGNIMLCDVLIGFSDEVVEKAIRYAVYMMAIDYENKCSEIKGVSMKTADFPDGKEKDSVLMEVPAELKFQLNVSHQEYMKIVDDFNSAIKQINGELSK